MRTKFARHTESKVQTLKASWISTILNSSDSWSSLGKHYLNIIQDYTLVKLTFENSNFYPLIKRLPLFYQDAIVCFNKSEVCPKPNNREEILNQP